MYNYPYGDNQQINLNWIISEIIALHQRLDPDYTAPTFTQIYPFSETQQLNLDWILAELKTLKDLAPTPPPTELIDEIGQALIAGAYDADTSYQKNDYIVQDGKVYRANAATTGTFDPTKWNEVMLGNDLAIITRWADATNTYLNSLAASNIANDSSVTGTTVKDALNTLKNEVSEMTTDDVANESGVTGATATAALNALNATLQSLSGGLAYLAIGNSHVAIEKNKYVFVTNHATLTEGLYLTNDPLPANEPLTTTNLRAVSIGGLNNLIPQIYRTQDGITVIEFSFGLLIQTGRLSADFDNEAIVGGSITLPRYYNSTTFTAIGCSASTGVNAYLMRIGCYATANNVLVWSAGSGTGAAITATGRVFTWFTIGMASGF